MSEKNTTDRAKLASELGKMVVLYGGLSAEREVSLQSGGAILQALMNSGVNAVGLDVGRNVIEQLQKENPDSVFIALHGAGGEDGRMQALLEFMGLPYTGSGVQASSLCMDKLRTKHLWRGIDIPTPQYAVLESQTNWSAALKKVGGSAFVKPVHEGSSIGMSIASSPVELEQAYKNAARYDQTIMAEQYIRGAEYTVAILNGQTLPPIKLETDHKFYDYDAKYLADDTRYLCPCGLSEDKENEMRRLALRAFETAGCSGWGRIDVMADQANNFYLLEINTVPGMTSHSLVPMAAKAAGYSFEDLVLAIAGQAIAPRGVH